MTTMIPRPAETDLHWRHYERFLMLGSEHGHYETSLPDLRDASCPQLARCLKENGVEVVRQAAALLTSGRSHRAEPAIFALAQAVGLGSPETRKEALEIFPHAIRSSAHLYQFCRYVRGHAGWGRSLRSAMAAWYNRRSTTELVYQVIRAPYDRSWSHRDILRLAHPKPPTDAHDLVYRWISTGAFDGDTLGDPGLELLNAYMQLGQTSSLPTVRALLTRWPALREILPGRWLRHGEVWTGILPSLSAEALVRWMPQMIEHDMLERGTPAYRHVLDRLRERDFASRGHLQPFQVLSAWAHYRYATTLKGGAPTSELVQALNAAYHQALAARTPTGGTTVIAIDPVTSTALDGLPALPGMSPRLALTAIALEAATSSAETHLLSFGGGRERFSPVGPDALEAVQRLLDALPSGAPDVASPVGRALEQGLKADTFLLLSGTRPNPVAHPPEQVMA
ncbi:MAG: TROVE domain-containing protein, partial [Candidatus Sericytochromatia bacterium]